MIFGHCGETFRENMSNCGFRQSRGRGLWSWVKGCGGRGGRGGHIGIHYNKRFLDLVTMTAGSAAGTVASWDIKIGHFAGRFCVLVPKSWRKQLTFGSQGITYL